MPRPDLRHGLTRRILRLATPIMLANLTQPLMSAVDTGVAGHFPDPAGLGGVFIGATRTRESMWSMLISAAIFLPLAGFASARYGNVGLWSALLAFMALRGITLGALLPRVWRSVR